MKRRIRFQRRVPGGRAALSTCVLHQIEDWIESQSKKYGVGRSFVIATAVAKVAGISEQEDYREPPAKAPDRARDQDHAEQQAALRR